METTRARIARTPALDGLRGVAVLAVLWYHHDAAAVPGGWLGVSLFFTLSGFLIADLLLAEHAQTRRIDLRAFWARRVRRLAPAALVGLVAAGVVLLARGDASASAAADIRAAALQMANWRFVAADAPYAGLEGAPSPVQHFWSLAIEEQFYLALPLVVAATLGRRGGHRLLAAVVGATIAASLASQVLLEDVERTYYGTDARAAELAVGVALALALPAVRSAIDGRRWMADVLTVTAGIGTLVAFAAAERSAELLAAGGLAAVTILWVGLLLGSLEGRIAPAVLGRRPLVALGAVSYGTYLLHWPVFLVLTSQRTGASGLVLLGLRLVVTLGLAAASAALVELPIRRGAVPTRRLVPAAGFAIASVVAATFVLAPAPDATVAAVAPPPPTSATVPRTDPAPRAVAGRPVAERAAAEPTAALPAAPALAVGAAEPTPATPFAATVPPPPTTAAAPARATRVLVIGDSTAGATGIGLQEAGAERGDAEVHLLHQPGCTALRQDVAKLREGYEFRSPCHDIVGQAIAALGDVRPDVVVVFLGSAQLADARYGDDAWRSLLEPSIEGAYRAAMADALARLAATGIPVLWADVPQPEWDLDAFGEMMGSPAPGHGEATTNDPARTQAIERIDAEVVAGHPTIIRWRYADALAGPDGRIDPEVRPDGLHVGRDAAVAISRDRLLDVLADAYRGVLATSGARVASGPRPAWTVG